MPWVCMQSCHPAAGRHRRGCCAAGEGGGEGGDAMKRITDDQLRRRIAKVKGLNPKWLNYDIDAREWTCSKAVRYGSTSVPADWLESLDAACALLEELKREW